MVSVSSPAVEEMVLIFSSLPSKIPFSKNEKHFKCQQDLLKLLQSKQSSTLCQEENLGTKHLNEALEPPGESAAYLERGSRGAERSVFGSEQSLQGSASRHLHSFSVAPCQNGARPPACSPPLTQLFPAVPGPAPGRICAACFQPCRKSWVWSELC